VVTLMMLPVVLDRDSFPVSTYPMYSRARPAEVTIPSAIGFDEAGDEHRLTLGVIGASDDPLIVAGELRTAIAQGRADARCAAIAERAGRGLADEFGLVRIEVVMERHDVVAQVTGEPSLLARTVHADCAVGASP
jgi:predicted regulator of Ras-like GTPase activity (Roadblock/LC7/MglB family)